MKKIILSSFFLLIITVSYGANLVKNGNFDKFSSTFRPANWGLSWAKPPGLWQVDTKKAISKPGALLISNKPGEDTIVCQVVKLKPNTVYRFSCWMKGEGIKSGKKYGGARFYLQNKGKIVYDGSPAGLFKRGIGTFDWGKVSCTFNSKKFTSGMSVIYLTLRVASGKVWYDDVTIEEVKEAEAKKKTPISAKLFPVDFQAGQYSVCKGLPGMLFLDIKGRNLASGQEVYLQMDLPAGFKLLGGCPWLPTGFGKNKEWLFAPDKISASPVTRNGKTYTRYKVSMAKALLRRTKNTQYNWGNYDRIFIESNTTNKKGFAYWKIVAKDDKTQSKEHRFMLKALPPIKTPRAKSNFAMMIGFLRAQTCPFPKISNVYTRYWTSLSKNAHTLALFHWHNKSLAARESIEKNFKVSLMLSTCYATPRLEYTGMWQKLRKGELAQEFPPIVNAAGKKDFGAIAPYYLIEDPKGLFWDKYFVAEMKYRMRLIKKTEMIIYDIEPGVNHGFSLENRIRFAAFAKLNKTPSIDEINSKYSQKWFKFRVVQHSKMIKKFCETIHKHFPQIKAAVSTDPIHSKSPILAKWCGVDARLSDAEVDVFMNMPYYSGLKYFNDMALNVKVLKKPNFPFIDPSEGEERFYKRYTPQSVKQNIVVTAAMGGIGIGFWPTDAFDGRYFHEISKAYDLLAVGGPFYRAENCSSGLQVTPQNVISKKLVDGKKINKISFPNFQTTLKTFLHRSKHDWLVTAINYNKHWSCIFKIKIASIPDGNYIVEDIGNNTYLTGKKSNAITADELRKGILLEIVKSGVALIKISPLNGKFPAGRKRSAKSILKTLKQVRQKLNTVNCFKTLRRDGAGITWGMLAESDGAPKLKFQFKGHEIYISPERGAEICAWKPNSRNEDNLFYKSRGFLGELMFYDSKQRKAPYDFKLKKINIVDGCPTAEFCYTVPGYEGANADRNPLEGLVVEKNITLQKNGHIRSSYTFSNRSPRKTTQKFGFRVKSYPRLGGRLAGNKSIAEISRVEYSSPRGAKTIRNGVVSGNYLIKKGCENLSFLNSSQKIKPWQESPLSAIAEVSGQVEMMKFQADKKLTAGYLIWWGVANYTVEMLSKDISLKYGESITYSYLISKK